MICYVVRTIIMATVLILVMRLTGKRQIGALQPSELAITILLSNISTLPIENTNIPISFGIMPILAVSCFEIFISIFGMKSKKFREFIYGRPIFIVNDGKINQKSLNLLRMTIDDLNKNLRSCGVFDISQVEYAIVETNGKLSVAKKFAHQTITPKMINLQNCETAIPLTIIYDGKLIENNIEQINLSYSWVKKYLDGKNLKIDEIFLMTADKNKNIFTVKKDENN